ncbi:GspH/FimT family pseudopilin [Pseudoalteromonas sp. Ld20]|uniref:GspH/FimT family pseudopilin n=1 Tax=Pseudoalteromonas sp. Ld20 TaxID=649165 RepID=UPI00386B4BBF
MKQLTPLHQHSGITLIEIMIGVCILSILLHFTVFQMSEVLARVRAENNTALLHRGLYLSRLYAIEHNTFTTFCAMKNKRCVLDQWDKQVVAFTDKKNFGVRDPNEEILMVFDLAHQADRLKYPRRMITFRPDGTPNALNNGTFIYCPNYQQAKLAGYAVTLSQTGRARVKSTKECQSASL